MVGSRGTRLGVLATVLAAAGAGAPARADEAFRCEVGEVKGLPSADASTAAQLVCDEVRRASGGQGRFRIGLASLGRVVIVTATREDPAGSVTVQVQGLEEVPTAAPRIADALLRGLNFASTQRVDNLLEGETRAALTKKGSIQFTAGVADVESIGFGARSAGFSLGFSYASPRFALPVEMRFASNDMNYGEQDLSLFSISVGGRWYLSTKNTSPFVGAGMGALRLHAEQGYYPTAGDTGYFYAERFGVAPYVEGGVEFLRTHRGRLALLVRADFPTSSLHSEPAYDWNYDTNEPGRLLSPAQSRYVVPVSIGVQVAF